MSSFYVNMHYVNILHLDIQYALMFSFYVNIHYPGTLKLTNFTGTC